MGVSRKCVKTWIDRYAAEGEAGLADRSSRPHTMPDPDQRPRSSTQVVELRRAEQRDGPDWLGAELGVPARTVSRVLRRHRRARTCASCDPMTGEVIRSSKTTAVRYERDRPGELVHMDVKKIGRIPDGGGWRAHGRAHGHDRDRKTTRIGYDYVHSLVDDHSRLAYSEILPDEKGATCAAFLARAAAYFAGHGITRIERVMTDNAWAYRYSLRERRAPTSASSRSSSSPTAPGRTARSNASTAPCTPSGPTGRSSPPTTSAPPPLRPGSSTTTLERRHSALGGLPPISRLSPT